METLSLTDPLTGVSSRRVFEDELPRELARARRAELPVSVAVIDLDHLGAFNMLRGEREGDRLIKEAAALWRGELREVDTLARLGGGTFGLILPNCGLADAVDVLDRVRAPHAARADRVGRRGALGRRGAGRAAPGPLRGGAARRQAGRAQHHPRRGVAADLASCSPLGGEGLPPPPGISRLGPRRRLRETVGSRLAHGRADGGDAAGERVRARDRYDVRCVAGRRHAEGVAGALDHERRDPRRRRARRGASLTGRVGRAAGRVEREGDADHRVGAWAPARVRHATRAPEERPPSDERQLRGRRSQLSDPAVQPVQARGAAAASGARRPGRAARRAATASGRRCRGDRPEVGRMTEPPAPWPRTARARRLGRRMDVARAEALRGLELEHGGCRGMRRCMLACGRADACAGVDEAGAPVRVDKWLWAARLVKTARARRGGGQGRARASNGQAVEPSRDVGPGTSWS